MPVHRLRLGPRAAPGLSTGSTDVLRLAPQLATRDEGRRWVDYNGPVSPDLIDAVARPMPTSSPSIPYLYHPTVAAIGQVPVPAVLHPAAHDEPALYLPVFRGTFGDADAFCFHTAAERLLVERTYPVAEKPQIVLGLGVGESAGAGRPGGGDPGPGRPAVHRERGSGGRAQGLQDAGRVLRHLQGAAPGAAGPGAGRVRSRWTSIRIPTSWSPGVVEEADKWDIVRDALVAVSPSALESFSLVVLEAWVDRVPVMVNGTCGPTREHCERSGGGLWFTSYPEFEAALDRLLGDPGLRATLGRTAGPTSTATTSGRC